MSMGIVILDSFDLEMRRFQLGVWDDNQMNPTTLLNTCYFIAFLVELIGGTFNRHLGQNLPGIIF